jgi:hypothetical protein
MTINNITNNNSFGAGPPGQPFQVQNSTEGESTTNRVVKRKLEEFQETNTDLAQQNPEGIKHQKIETRTLSEILPNELWTLLLSFLDFKDLPSLRLSSKEFHHLAHATLKCGLKTMDSHVMHYIGKASEMWNLSIKLDPMNLTPIHTKIFKMLRDLPPEKFFCGGQSNDDWERMLSMMHEFLDRAPSLEFLDLYNVWHRVEDENNIELPLLDLEGIMSGVSPTFEHLDLSHNYLEIPAVLATLKTHGFALKTLFLNDTLLQNKKSLTENKELPTVDLNDLPRTLHSLKLESLKKIDNQIPLFQLTGDFPTSLTKLSLADNNILPENSLPSLPTSLTYLNCSWMRANNNDAPFFKESDLSRIKEFPFGSLVTLNLSNNQLTDKSLEVIIHNPDSPLKKIDLSGNHIMFKEIDLETRFPRTLTLLNLGRNRIRRLDRLIALVFYQKLTKKMPISINRIVLEGNPLKERAYEDIKKLKMNTKEKKTS